METAKKTGEDYKKELKNSSISWENEIRSLVRIASLIVLILFIFEIADSTNEFAIWLKTILYALFISGIGLIYFQLRWLNTNRHKITNFGGILAFLGLIITITPSIIQLFFGNIFTSVESFYFTLLFIMGLILVFIGVFFETTRLDEPIIYWFKINIIFATRMIFFSISILVMLYGYLNWDFSYSNYVPTIIFGFGYSLGIAIWLNHPYFKWMGSALSASVSFLGYMIFYSLSMGFTAYTEIIVNTGWFLLLLGISVNVVLWSKEIVNFLRRVITNIIEQIANLINRFINLVIEILKGIDRNIRIFVQFLRDHYKTIIRSFLTLIGSFLIYLGLIQFLNNNQILEVFDFEIGTHASGLWLLAIGLIIIYLTSLKQFNQIFLEIYRDFENGVKNLIKWFRKHQKIIILYSARIFGSFIIIGGVLVYQVNILLSLGALVSGIFILGLTWRIQIKQILMEIYQYLRNTVKEIMTVLGLVLIISGIFLWFVDPLMSVVATTSGLFIIIVLWRIEIKQAWIYVYKGSIKTLKYFGAWIQLHRKSIILYSSRIIGLLFILSGIFLTFIAFWLRTSMIIVGIIFTGTSWRTEIKEILIHIYQVTVKAGKQFITWSTLQLKNTYKAIQQFLSWLKLQVKNTFNLIVKTIKNFYTWLKLQVNYIYKMTVKVVKDFIAWLQLHRKTILFYSVNIISIILILIGLILLSLNQYVEIAFLNILVGFLFLGYIWRNEIKQILSSIYIETVKISQQFIAWFQLHRKTIFLFFVRITASVLIIIGYLYDNPPINILIIAIGFILLGATWYPEIKRLSINVYRGIIKSINNFIAWFKFHRKAIFLFSVRITASLIIIIGFYLINDNPLVGIFVSTIGFILFSATWYPEIKRILINIYRAIVKAIQDFLIWLRLHRKTIIQISGSLLGFSFSFIGYILFFRTEFQVWGVFLVFLGFVIFGLTWRTQIKQTLISLYLSTKKIILHYTQVLYEGFLFLIQFISSFYIEIIRITLTSFGALFFLLGIVTSDSLIYLISFLLILIAWVDIILKAFIEAVRNLVEYLHENYVIILRYSSTLIGSFLLVVGIGIILVTNLVDLSENVITVYSIDVMLFGWLSLLIGIILNYIAWYKNINSYLLEILGKISDVAKQFLVSVREFTFKALIQLKTLIVSIVDSIIPIFLLLVSFVMVIVGIILIISGIFDPSGDWTIGIMNLPIVKQITMIIQWNTDPRNLLGNWADEDSIYQLVLGIGFSIIGIIFSLLVYLRFEKLKIHNFSASSQEG